MASPLPTVPSHGQLQQGPCPGETQVSAGDLQFHTSPPLTDQGTNHSPTCMMETAQFGPWSDLQPELLGLVLKRLPSLADRVRLRAVCHPWCSNSTLKTLPFPFPWLTLPNGTFLSIPGSEIHRIPLPDGARCHGSIDNRLFLMSNDGAFSLLNPFSKTTLELPNLVTVWQSEIDNHAAHTHDPAVSYKLVAPSPLDSSPKSLAAALIKCNGYSLDLCMIQPPAATYSFRGISTEDPPILVDLAFFDGRLYVVCEFFKLFAIDFGENLASKPNMECIIDSMGDYTRTPPYLSKKKFYGLWQYLLECGGRLLMVQRLTESQGFRNPQTVGFNVLEANLSTKPGQWRMVSDLGGHVLFLGKQSFKALPAEECSGTQEDCIYFVCDYPCPEASADPLRDAGIYNVRNGTIVPLHSGSPAVPQRQAGQWGLTWFFPHEAV